MSTETDTRSEARADLRALAERANAELEHAPAGRVVEWARAELSQLLADNYARFPAEASPDVPELADVEIAGEAKVMAG